MENTNKFYINGEWVEPSTSETLEVINPATEEAIATIAMGGKEDVDKAVAAAKAAFETFSQTTRGRAFRAARAHHRVLQSPHGRHCGHGIPGNGCADRPGNGGPGTCRSRPPDVRTERPRQASPGKKMPAPRRSFVSRSASAV